MLWKETQLRRRRFKQMLKTSVNFGRRTSRENNCWGFERTEKVHSPI